jgi:hypothetical protein
VKLIAIPKSEEGNESSCKKKKYLSIGSFSIWKHQQLFHTVKIETCGTHFTFVEKELTKFDMRIRFTILVAGLFSSGEYGLQTSNNESEIERHLELLGSPSSNEARKLGVGLAPTEVPYEPPGFKPTTTPTDRTKKPTMYLQACLNL